MKFSRTIALFLVDQASHRLIETGSRSTMSCPCPKLMEFEPSAVYLLFKVLFWEMCISRINTWDLCLSFVQWSVSHVWTHAGLELQQLGTKTELFDGHLCIFSKPTTMFLTDSWSWSYVVQTWQWYLLIVTYSTSAWQYDHPLSVRG